MFVKTEMKTFSLLLSVSLQLHFYKQMAKDLKRISKSTFWYGDLAYGNHLEYTLMFFFPVFCRIQVSHMSQGNNF